MILLNEEQDPNVLESIIVNDEDNLTDVRAVQPEKALVPILVTDGIMAFERAVHDSKALFAILIKEDGKTTELSE